MKILTILSVFITNILVIQAQITGKIGINTLSTLPNDVSFHVHGNSGDLIIKDYGFVGINTFNPDSKLHIVKHTNSSNASIRINDGSERYARVLTSNSIGEAKWSNIGITLIKGRYLFANGTTVAGKDLYQSRSSYPNLVPLYGQITLPPGQWCVYVTGLLNTRFSKTPPAGSYDMSTCSWLRLSFSEVWGGQRTDDFQPDKPWFSGNVYAIPYGFIQGFCILTNSSGSNKTYYLGAYYLDDVKVQVGSQSISIFDYIEIANFGRTDAGEDGIIAVKLN